MALDYRSNTFRETYKTLEEISKQGQLTPDVARQIVQEKGIDVNEFKAANKKFDAFKQQPRIKAMLDRGIDPTEPTIIDQIFLAPTRMIGKIAEGVVNLTDAGTKAVLEEDTYDRLKKTLDEYIPEEVEQAANAFTDPYHGEGILGATSKITGDIGSYVLGTKKVVDLANIALKSGTIAPRLANMVNKMGRKTKLATKGGAYGLAGAVGTTIVEDPRQNSVDYVYALLSDNPDALKRLEAYSNDPTNPELSDYFNALLKNIAVEVPLVVGFAGLGSLIPALAQKHKGKISNKINSVSTRLNTITEPIGKTKIGRKAKQYLTSRRGTDDETLARVIEREAGAGSAMKIVQGYANDLETSIKNNLTNQIKTNPNYVEDVVDQALKGNEDAKILLQSQSPETAKIVDDMRLELNKVQKELSRSTGTSSNLSLTIDNSLGTYMNRSYEVFDNPEYKKEIQKRVSSRMNGLDREGKIGDRVVDNAAAFIARQNNVSIDDPLVQLELEKLVGTTTTDKNAFYDFMEDIANKQAIYNKAKPLTKRKDVPLEIRDLFGEVKDPVKNFSKTYEKLATLNAENKFLEDMAITLERKFQQRVDEIMEANPNLIRGQAELRAKETMVDTSEVGSNALNAIVGKGPLSSGAIKNPLQGVYADEEYLKIMKDGLNPTFNSKLLNWLVAAKGISQKVKTVYNPATHGKNIVGNYAMLGANGMLPTGESASVALQSVLSTLGKKSNADLGKRLALYNRLGITNSNLGLGEIRKNMQVAAKDIDGWMDNISTGKAARKYAKKGDEYITNLYQAEDDYFKIVHFEKTKDYLSKAYPDIPEEEIIQMAAQRTRDMMPNYNLVPTAVKALRVTPVGDFVSFPAEMTRISKNLAKYTMKDLTSGNNVLQKEGAKRLGGMTIVGSAPAIAAAGSRALYNIDEEQAQALDMVGPAYEINQDKIYLSPINKDKNNHWGVDYVNVGAWDPFSYLKSFAKNSHDLIMMGTGMDSEKTNYEFNKTATALIDQTISPFLGPSMLTEAVLDLARGRDYSEEPTLKGKLQKLGRGVIDIADPGFYKWWERRQDYERSGMTDYYSTIPESATELEALLGLKTQRADLSTGMRFNFNPEFNNVYNSQKQMNKVFQIPNATEDEIMDKFKDAQRVRLKGFKNTRDMLKLYKTLGLDMTDIINGLTMDDRRNFSQFKAEIISGADENIFIPFMPKETPEIAINQAPVPWNRMIRGYEMLNGKGLD
jgi:hypothetical protein